MPVNGLKGGVTPAGDKVVRNYVQNSNVSPDGYTVESISKPADLLMIAEENTFASKLPGKSARDHPMNDGKLDMTWDAVGSMHRRINSENLRSGYSDAAFADGHVDWVFMQNRDRVTYTKPDGSKATRNEWSTVAFSTDYIPNPTAIDESFINESMDFSFSY